jgi:acetylornithine deacetylase
MEKLKEYVEDINERFETVLDTRGPVSKYILPDENLQGR